MTLVTTVNSLCEVTAHPDDGLLSVCLFWFWVRFVVVFVIWFFGFFFCLFGFSIHLFVCVFVVFPFFQSKLILLNLI